MKGINLLFLIAAVALPVSAFAKRGEGFTDSRSLSEEDLRTYGKLNTLVSRVSEARPSALVTQPEVVRPKQISFAEQRNLIILAAVDIRSDWYLYTRKLIADGVSLKGEEKLAKLYFYYLEAQVQIDRDEGARLDALVKEAFALNNFEQARLEFSRAIIEARKGGKSAEDLRSLREEVYGDMENPPSEDDVVYLRDVEKAERAARATEKTFKRLIAEAGVNVTESAFNINLLEQAKMASKTLAPAFAEIFDRPDGFPVIDRAGSFFTSVEWAAMGGALPPPQRSNFRSLCAKMLSKLVAKK